MAEKQRFAHLHVHSDYSRIDGLGTIESKVTEAKRLGFESLALTDHGTLSGAVSFYSVCLANGIKPIIGVEGYVELDGKINHITLLANGNRGLSNLIKINNIGHRSELARPAFRVDDILRHSDDVMLLTGCQASPFYNLSYEEARSLAQKFKSAMPGRVFAEVMFVGDTAGYDRAEKLSRDLNLPPIVTNDVHFTREDQGEVHHLLTNLKAAFEYNSRRLFMTTRQQLEERAALFGKDASKLAKRGLDNALLLSNRIEQVVFDGKPTLPDIPNSDKKLWELSIDGIKRKAKSPKEAKEMHERLVHEFKIIRSMGFSTYFLILEDLVSHAKSTGIRVGPGRGSGAGSLILFLIGVTEINPLTYDLWFERFLNPQRKGMPDVDLDFDSDGRDQIIQYAEKRWAAHPVAIYSRYMHKTLVHELCKYLKLDRDLDVKASDEGTDSQAFLDLCHSSELFEKAYNSMIGQVKTIGQHAGGIVVTSAPVPLEKKQGGGEVVAAWTEGKDQELSQAGIVKYDILGLTTLSLLKRLEDKFGYRAPDLEPGGPEFGLLASGDTLGIFQFTGSQGITDYVKLLKPNSLEDISAASALYRPGALDAGTAFKYPEWKKKPRKIHPVIDPILSETYGVIVYQEQLMKIFAALTDGNMASADQARKTLSKIKGDYSVWEASLASLKEKMFTGGKEKGLDDETLEHLWEEIKTHTRYSFNRAHSISYGKITADCLWWKFHHRADFYAALLTVDPGDAQRTIISGMTSGIEFKLPHVNTSHPYEFLVEGNTILFPLSVVKYLGGLGAAHIIEAKGAKPFESIKDFMTRCKKKAVRANARIGLWELASFEGLEGTREELQIKESDLKNTLEKQMKYLGFIIPTRKMISVISSPSASGVVKGIITSVEARTSNYGQYSVIRTMPGGTCWTRGLYPIPGVGDVVMMHVGKNGKLKSWNTI